MLTTGKLSAGEEMPFKHTFKTPYIFPDLYKITVLEYVIFSSLPDWLYLGQNDLSTHKHFVMVVFF